MALKSVIASITRWLRVGGAVAPTFSPMRVVSRVLCGLESMVLFLCCCENENFSVWNGFFWVVFFKSGYSSFASFVFFVSTTCLLVEEG